MEWYHKLKELRAEKAMTLKEVAAELAIPLQTYAAYEHGTREPSFDMLKRLCKLYDVSSDYLIGLTDSY